MIFCETKESENDIDYTLMFFSIRLIVCACVHGGGMHACPLPKLLAARTPPDALARRLGT